MYQNEYRPKVMSDYFGLIRIDRVFRYVHYEDGEDIPRSFHDMANYENGYNNSEVGHIYWKTILSKYVKVASQHKIILSQVVQNIENFGWWKRKMSSCARTILHDVMSEYGNFR